MAENNQEEREHFCKQLAAVPFLSHDNTMFCHGRGYVGPIEGHNVFGNATNPQGMIIQLPPG